MPSLTVAVAQIECVAGNLAANLEMHLDAAEQAKALGVDLLLFPELSLTDYLSAPDCNALAMTPGHAILERLAAASAGTILSAGFIERGPEGQFFNSQGLFRNGQLLAVHRKLNLPGYGALREDQVYTPGAALAPVALDQGWRAATLICADCWNPALPWLAALSGANLLLAPSASALAAIGEGFDNPHGWEINLAHTAMTYGLPVLFANHCGARDGLGFWGGSRILDASGREIARAGAKPELICATLTFEDGECARNRLPTIRDSNPPLVSALLSNIQAGSRQFTTR